MNCGKCSSKTLMGFLGLLFFVAGLACIVIGSIIINRYQVGTFSAAISTRNYIIIPSGILILVGFVLFFAGISGCCNMCRESKGCLCSFFMFLLLVVVLMITAASLGTVYRDDINDNLNKTMFQSMEGYNYNGTNNTKREIDDMNQAFQCCGSMGPSDWNTVSFGEPPASCYPNKTVIPGKEFKNGCFNIVKQFFDKNFGYIIGGAVGLLIILILGMIGSCALIYYKRNEDKYFTLS